MGKIKKCAGKESFERMNYLYQVSNYIAGIEKKYESLSREYLNLMINVSKKTVQRIGIDMKRTICKGCKAPQVPGVNARVRVKRKHVKWVCCVCGTVKVFRVDNPKYEPWTLTEQAVVETLDFKHCDE